MFIISVGVGASLRVALKEPSFCVYKDTRFIILFFSNLLKDHLAYLVCGVSSSLLIRNRIRKLVRIYFLLLHFE